MGLIHIYCGDGKGKTTASMGLAVRAAGAGMRVHIVQLLKGSKTAELESLALIPNIRVTRPDRNYGFTFSMTDEDKAAITKCHNALLEEALREMKNDEIDMLVIDEFCAGYNCGLVDKALADEIILHKPEKCELVLTGRDPEQKYVDAADYVSEIRAVKHPYEKGIDARRGIAIISRMKYINRWGLMRNTINENISEHSLETAFIAHVLALYRNVRFGGNVDPERAALLAMYHDATEIITGDLPTPVKYYNAEIKAEYDKVEKMAEEKLLSYLPEDLRGYYAPLFSKTEEDKELWVLVKAADKLSALIKCIEERQMGNSDFTEAEKSTLQAVHDMALPEAEEFISEFLSAYHLTLDGQAK